MCPISRVRRTRRVRGLKPRRRRLVACFVVLCARRTDTQIVNFSPVYTPFSKAPDGTWILIRVVLERPLLEGELQHFLVAALHRHAQNARSLLQRTHLHSHTPQTTSHKELPGTRDRFADVFRCRDLCSVSPSSPSMASRRVLFLTLGEMRHHWLFFLTRRCPSAGTRHTFRCVR